MTVEGEFRVCGDLVGRHGDLRGAAGSTAEAVA